jgi:hypothetical protein
MFLMAKLGLSENRGLLSLAPDEMIFSLALGSGGRPDKALVFIRAFLGPLALAA